MITITRDKIYRSPFSLKNTQSNSNTVKVIESKDVVKYLGESVEFGEDLKFSDVFELIILHKDFFNTLFSSDMRNLLIDDFIEDYERVYDINFKEQVYKLRLMWICDVYEYDGTVDYFDYVSFDAYGKIDKEIDTDDYGISIAYSSLGYLKDSNIFIDNRFEIQSAKSFENDIEAVFKSNYRAVTLYEAFCAILREISFYGKPEERDALRREMERRKRDVDMWIDGGAIDENSKSWSEVEDEIDSIMGEEEENYGTFWDYLYPKEEVVEEKTEEEAHSDALDDAIIELAEDSDLPLEQQMQDAADEDDYERAARIKKLIEKRDGKKN